MFVRKLAVGTNLTQLELSDLLERATYAIEDALVGQRHTSEGRMAFKIHVGPDEIVVDLVYRAVHFPPAEFVSLS
jgi:hypothetical protein